MPCTPEHPCGGRPYVEIVAMRADHRNLTGALLFRCPVLTCTREYWDHSQTPLSVRERPSSRGERIREGLNAEPHFCAVCHVPMERNAANQVRCHECSRDAELARHRRVREARRAIRPPCDICGLSMAGEYLSRVRHAGTCDRENRRRYQRAWRTYRPSTTQRGKATGGGIKVAKEIAMAGLGK